MLEEDNAVCFTLSSSIILVLIFIGIQRLISIFFYKCTVHGNLNCKFRIFFHVLTLLISIVRNLNSYAKRIIFREMKVTSKS